MAPLRECPRLGSSWSNLPSELLQLITEELGLIDLLSFQGVCKGWRIASSTASAAVESIGFDMSYGSKGFFPSYLLQTDDGKCLFYYYYTREEKNYSIDIPELKDASVLASYEGWLLLFLEGSLFFFCPFSRARIDLPKFPHSEIHDRIAALSDPPTSSDCILSVMNPLDKSSVELNLLRRGADTWTKDEYKYNRSGFRIGSATGATYSNGTFYFVDCWGVVLAFSVHNETWARYIVGEYTRKWKGRNEDVSISVIGGCGGRLPSSLVIPEYKIKATKGGREVKGVWIYPRFYQISPNLSW